ENQTDIDLSAAGTVTVGGGFTLQSVNTTRYAGRRAQKIWHAFLQHEWTPLSQLHIIAGLRYDHNSAFAARVSPKIALQYRVHETLRFTASYGGGFKAPDFRQLYLSFVNNAADGYSIFGASEFSLALLQQQMRQGMIAQILPAAAQITSLRPEISNGINACMHWKPVAGFTMDVNLFRNDIRNLINYIPVATQANGTAVFSYVNTRRAFTQGVELQVEQKLNEQWQLSGGYQFLETADKDILQAVKAGTVFGREVPGAAARRMQLRDYHGLLNRSKHMANLRLFYQHQQRGWSGSLRFIYRSRLGVLDLDGNNFANMKAEFAPSILQVNIAVGKNITKHLALQTGVNNLLNQTNARFMPNMAGTHYFVTIQYTHK
ncbi:MAG: TonB-dependent receptor plug domain-containing protein, partial [Chitinophagaceae bacterium]